MQQIQLQRLDVLFRRAGFEADVVVYSDVVDKDIEPAKFADRLFDDGGAVFGRNDVRDDEAAFRAGVAKVFFELIGGFHVFVHDDGDGAFALAAAHDGGANSLPAAGNKDALVFQLPVHASPLSTDRTPLHCPRT